MTLEEQQLADQLGGAVLIWAIKIVVFLVILAIIRWGLDIGRILKNQRETIELLGEIRDRLPPRADVSPPQNDAVGDSPPSGDIRDRGSGDRLGLFVAILVIGVLTFAAIAIALSGQM